MAKKTKGKRTVTCGKCGKSGHNARSCKPAPTKAGVEKGPIQKTVVESSADIPPPPTKKGSKTRIDMRVEEQRQRRPAPTADTGTAATAAPYRCPKCNSVAILCIVRVKDFNETFKKKRDIYTGEMRCEQCMNKPNPAELILVWGAKPGQTVTAEEANPVSA